MAETSLTRRGFFTAAIAFLSDNGRQAEIRAIEDLLVAPCCWRQQVSIHQTITPQVEAVRAEVRRLVLAGRSRQEILAVFVDTYGVRILASPPPRGFFMLAYLMTPVAFGVGAFAFAFFIYRARRGTLRE
jgi:cytochrome c-type biogenesis protein CcmH/NrfF